MSKVPELRHDPGTGIIYMHWTEPGERGQRGRSKRASTGARDMVAAKAFLGRWLLLEQEQPLPAPDKESTISELWTLYDEKHVQRNVTSTASLAECWKNLEAHFGASAVSQVSQDTVDKYEEKRRNGRIGRGAGNGTIRKELAALRACLNWCADPKRRILDAAKLPNFDLPPDSEPRDRWLRTPEIQKLLKAASEVSARMGNRMGRGERFCWLALETGARAEAIRQLTWGRVDFEQWTIDYNVPGRKLTKKRRTVVPISQALREPLLRMYAERLADDGHVLDTDAEVWKLVKTIAANAGLLDVSPHVLRHTAATHMARRGVPLWIIAKVLGNTLAMVERVYAKHCPDDLRSAVDMISTGKTYSDPAIDLRAGGAQTVASS